MKTHRKTSAVCFLADILFLIFTIVLKLLDNFANYIFYDVSIAIFTGLFVSLVIELSMYYNEKNLYIHKLYNKLVLIYTNLLDINYCSIMQKKLLNTNEIFTQPKYTNVVDVCSEQMIKNKSEIDFTLYTDLLCKKNKSKFKLYLMHIQKIFSFDLQRVRQLNSHTIILIEKHKIKAIEKETAILKKRRDESVKVDLNAFDIDLKKTIDNINECISRQEEISYKLLSDIERNIIILREMYKFEGEWNSEKDYIKKTLVSQTYQSSI